MGGKARTGYRSPAAQVAPDGRRIEFWLLRFETEVSDELSLVEIESHDCGAVRAVKVAAEKGKTQRALEQKLWIFVPPNL